MSKVYIIGKKGSRAKIEISKNTDVKLYKGLPADAIVNYGLAGDKLSAFMRKYRKLNSTPIINHYIGRSKYRSVKDVESKGIMVPDSKITLGLKDKLSDWIEKRVNSSQGKGIIKARHKKGITGKYYQKFIGNRRYELRVHSFLWLPIDDWSVQKRIGPADQITWNYHTGGHFQTVSSANKYNIFKDAKDISKEILKIHNMAFGAVDLIVTDDFKIYFIEINSSPGFSNLSGGIYFNAINKLTKLTPKKLRGIAV